jgi:hypothetical protein
VVGACTSGRTMTHITVSGKMVRNTVMAFGKVILVTVIRASGLRTKLMAMELTSG